MGVLDDFLNAVGGVYRRAHLFSFSKVSAEGVYPAFTRDLRPIHEDGLTGGHLVELWCVLDESQATYRLTAASRIRFDILEEDFLLLGGLDDQVVSIVGTGAVAPDPAVPSVNRSVTFNQLPAGMSVPEYVELYKHTASLLPGSPPYDESILILVEPEGAAGNPGTARTHVITWWRAEHVGDIGAHSELYFVFDVDNAQIEAASETLDLREAPPGVAVRVTGTVLDAQPFTATPEPLFDVPVTLGGRVAVTRDDGGFLIDARLPVGDHRLEFRRPGIDTRELTVRITADNAGKVTAAVFDSATQRVTATTAAAATHTSRLDLALPEPLQIRVHKLRGKVLWPDSRRGSEEPAAFPAAYVAMLPAYHGTPLAERRVYVLPLPAGATFADHRPTSTRKWEELKKRPGVLRSARPGRPVQRERTDVTGAFEVKYVDMTANNQFLFWTERLDPRTAGDTLTETPEQVVRTLQLNLIELTGNVLTDVGVAGTVLTRLRNLVDHEYNLTNDPLTWGVDAIRILDLGGVLTLVRPSRANRQRFEEAALPAGVGERVPIPASRVVENIELQVLPLVRIGEAADLQGNAARRMSRQLEIAASTAFPDGFDLAPVEFVLDMAHFNDWVDRTAAAPTPWQAATPTAAVVELLERTFVVRRLLRRRQRLGVDDARWHIDAITLADYAFVSIPRGAGNDFVARRRLDATVVPVLEAVSPLLPGMAARGAYLAPGHGLYAHDTALASAAPADWRTNRGGYAATAGEDEVDLLLASEVNRIGKRNGLAVRAPRELENFIAPGVSNAAAVAPALLGTFPQVLGDPDFPRLWQQNPVYYLGSIGDPIVTAHPQRSVPVDFHPPLPPMPPHPARPRLGEKNGQGIDARIEHIRSGAARVDIVLAPHTNAGGGRGTMAEYLNVQPSAAVAGEGNPLGLAFSQKLIDRFTERTRLQRYPRPGFIDQDNVDQPYPAPGANFVRPAVSTYPTPLGYRQGLATMNNINPEAVGDLTDTFSHWRRTNALDGTLTNLRVVNPPVGAGPPAWRQEASPINVPVSLVELAFHDERNDVAFLTRAWFRRLAAEAMAEAIDLQLRDDPAAITADDVRSVLRHLFGETDPVRALPRGAVPLPRATVQAAVQATALDVEVVVGAALGDLVAAALRSARVQTRQLLIEEVRDELRTIAGYEAADDADVDRFVVGPMIGGAGLADLARPDERITRAEAGVFVCRAVGLRNASLQTAETQAPPPHQDQPVLMRPAPGRPNAYFPPVEALPLIERVRDLEPVDIYHLETAFFADASWAPLGANDAYTLDPGTPVLIVAETAGAAWKATVADVEFRIVASSYSRELGCSRRDPQRLVSKTWVLDLPTTDTAIKATVTVRVKHRIKGWETIGSKTMDLKVVAPAVPAPS